MDQEQKNEVTGMGQKTFAAQNNRTSRLTIVFGGRRDTYEYEVLCECENAYFRIGACATKGSCAHPLDIKNGLEGHAAPTNRTRKG
ncbi:hypothetical protein TKK_0010780 [Trichogramma kaykai]